jgi:hypothetical protein
MIIFSGTRTYNMFPCTNLQALHDGVLVFGHYHRESTGLNHVNPGEHEKKKGVIVRGEGRGRAGKGTWHREATK